MELKQAHMKEIDGDIWDYWQAASWVVITTNGTIKRDGRAVMGRGVARDCANKIPEMPAMLGEQLRLHGNHVFTFLDPFRILTFPVKHGWYDMASPDLIRRSAYELVDAVNAADAFDIYLPRPGCGNGGLHWYQVKPLIEGILDHRFTVVWKRT